MLTNYYLLESLLLFQLLSYAPQMMVMVTLLKWPSGKILERQINCEKIVVIYCFILILTKTCFEMLSSSSCSPVLP